MKHVRLILLSFGLLSGLLANLRAGSLDTWTIQNSGTTNDLFGIAYANNRYVVAGTNGTILLSTDGATWSNQTSGTTNDLNAVTFGAGIFVAVGGNGTILTSLDGAAWTSQASGFPSAFHAIIYANGQFLTVGPPRQTWSHGLRAPRELLRPCMLWPTGTTHF